MLALTIRVSDRANTIVELLFLGRGLGFRKTRMLMLGGAQQRGADERAEHPSSAASYDLEACPEEDASSISDSLIQ